MSFVWLKIRRDKVTFLKHRLLSACTTPPWQQSAAFRTFSRRLSSCVLYWDHRGTVARRRTHLPFQVNIVISLRICLNVNLRVIQERFVWRKPTYTDTHTPKKKKCKRFGGEIYIANLWQYMNLYTFMHCWSRPGRFVSNCFRFKQWRYIVFVILRVDMYGIAWSLDR